MARAEHEVRAVVEARLFGLRLLSLRAHVITGEPTPRFMGHPVDEPIIALPPVNGTSTLVEAIDLLSEGSKTLRALPNQSALSNPAGSVG